MDEIPENLKQAMNRFAVQTILMDKDPDLIELNKIRDELLRQVSDVDKRINEASEKYTVNLEPIEEYITAQILEVGQNIEHSGVKANHRKGYERITWNNKKITPKRFQLQCLYNNCLHANPKCS